MKDFVLAVLAVIGLTSAQEVTISNKAHTTNETAVNQNVHQKNVVVFPQAQVDTFPYPHTIFQPLIPLEQFVSNAQLQPIEYFGSFDPFGAFGAPENFYPFFPNIAEIGQGLVAQSDQVQFKDVQVPQPYPVYVSKPVPVQVQIRVPVEVPKPYPVKVPQPVPVPVKVKVPVPVEKPYPVSITRTVVVPVEKPVYIRVPEIIQEPYPVEIPQFSDFNSTQFQEYFSDPSRLVTEQSTTVSPVSRINVDSSGQVTSSAPELNQINKIQSKAEDCNTSHSVQSKVAESGV